MTVSAGAAPPSGLDRSIAVYAVQLVLKLLHFAGELTGVEISHRLGLDFQVVEPAVIFLKRLHQVEIVGGSAIGGPSYLYRITDGGRERALLFLENNHYVGAAPVPLAQYVAYLNAYRQAMPRSITRERVRQLETRALRELRHVAPALQLYLRA